MSGFVDDNLVSLLLSSNSLIKSCEISLKLFLVKGLLILFFTNLEEIAWSFASKSSSALMASAAQIGKASQF